MSNGGRKTFEAFEADLKRKVPALAEHQARAAVAEAFTDRVLKGLRATRRLANLTQAQVGQRMGVDQSFVAKLERGKVEMTLFWLARFCEALEHEPVFQMMPKMEGVHVSKGGIADSTKALRSHFLQDAGRTFDRFVARVELASQDGRTEKQATES